MLLWEEQGPFLCNPWNRIRDVMSGLECGSWQLCSALWGDSCYGRYSWSNGSSFDGRYDSGIYCFLNRLRSIWASFLSVFFIDSAISRTFIGLATHISCSANIATILSVVEDASTITIPSMKDLNPSLVVGMQPSFVTFPSFLNYTVCTVSTNIHSYAINTYQTHMCYRIVWLATASLQGRNQSSQSIYFFKGI